MAKVVLLWPQRPRLFDSAGLDRSAWSASLLYETAAGDALTELFTITRANRRELEETLRDVCPGVKIVVLEQERPT